MTKENVWFNGKSDVQSSSEKKLASYLTLLETNSDNSLLVGACELGGSCLNGSLWLFEKPEDAPDPGRSIAGIEMEVGAADAKFLPSGTQLIAADYSGTLSLMDITRAADDCPVYFTQSKHFKSHDDFVTCLDIGAKGAKFLSGSVDKMVILWNIEHSIRENAFPHARAVTGIAIQPEQDAVFASVTGQGCCFLWDVRMETTERPASCIAATNVPNSSLDWVSDSVIAVADVGGNLSLVDTRTQKTLTRSKVCLRHGIRRVRAYSKLSQLAVAVDDLTLQVFSCRDGELRSLYKSQCHKDFISGLAWSVETGNLYSSGWDTQVISHTIPAIEDTPIPAAELQTSQNVEKLA